MEIDISIIIPVYNVESYLEDCIKSILTQDCVERCELLLIDDGSIDNSPNICDKYGRKYENIITYHKTNGGLSDARNYGLQRSKGEYVFFLDSDDMLAENVLSRLIHYVQKVNSDIVVADALKISNDSTLLEEQGFEYRHNGLTENRIYSGEEFVSIQLKAGYLQTTVWLGLYKRQFLIENQLWFKKGVLHEDELWSPIIFLEAKTVCYLNIEFYLYRVRENSIMRAKSKDTSKNIASLIYVYSTLCCHYEWKIEDTRLLRMMQDDLVRRYLHAIILWNFVDYPALMKKVHRIEILRLSRSFKNITRSLLLLFSPRIYARIGEMFIK